MIIDVKEKEEVVLSAKDPSKPDEHIFVYKLINLDSNLSDNCSSDFYVAVPNGKEVSLVDLPMGNYFMEKMNKE